MNTNRLMKIVPVSEMKRIDSATVQAEGITLFDLMERAATAWVNYFVERSRSERRVVVLCGPGDNGGDGLVIARLLHQQDYIVSCRLFTLGKRTSECNQLAKRLLIESGADFMEVEELSDEALDFSKYSTIIDALFGVGLQSPLTGDFATVVRAMNAAQGRVVAVDMPSGLFCEDNGGNPHENIVEAAETYTFQYPKLSFLLPENASHVGNWKVLNINLNREAIAECDSYFYGTTESFIKFSIPRTRTFTHKGLNGKGALIAGHSNMVGAAILASISAVRSGLGLLHTYLPPQGLAPLMARVPEAIPKLFNSHDDSFIELTEPDQYGAIAIGPGLGIRFSSAEGVARLLRSSTCRLVIDADGLNIIAENPDLMDVLPGRTILTPHPKEFERMVGRWADDFERLDKLGKFAVHYGVIVVLKDAYTTIALPDGKFIFNPTGNPGLAKGGAGDVLTGVLLALAAIRIPLDLAAVLGVYIHGLAADILAERYGMRGYTPSMVAENIGLAWRSMEKNFIKPKW